ncbi:MAG: sensor histidine kinase, partial [Lachnospiraceae bacterium]
EVMRDIPGEQTPENVQVIIDEATRLTTLVNDLLDISKLQSGVQTLNQEVYNFTQEVDEILKRYAKLIEQNQYSIDFEFDKEVKVFADKSKIDQVIYNLINNAVNYTGADKKVLIRQIANENTVRLEVTDTGAGIEPEQLKYIWDRYYKLDKNHKRAQIGTGLGLSIVRGVMELHNGKYGVISDVGRGSTFWFELNIFQENEQ